MQNSSLTQFRSKRLWVWKTLEKAVDGAAKVSDAEENALYYRREVFSDMGKLREAVDCLEGFIPASEWPVPSYGDLLFSVK